MQLSFFNLIKYYSIYSLIQRECTYYITWKFKSNVSFLLETICDKFNFNINHLIENNIIFSVTFTVLVFNVCVRLVTCTLATNINIVKGNSKFCWIALIWEWERQTRSKIFCFRNNISLKRVKGCLSPWKAGDPHHHKFCESILKLHQQRGDCLDSPDFSKQQAAPVYCNGSPMGFQEHYLLKYLIVSKCLISISVKFCLCT